MAGIRGNVANIIAQKQAVLGTPATFLAANATRSAMSGGAISPVRETDNLSETDSSRDIGVTFAKTTGVEGSPELYVRDEGLSFWLLATLGVDTVTGTTNLTHTITPTTGATSLPYLTVWKELGDTLFERYHSCRVDTLNLKGEAGMPFTLTVGLNGLESTRLSASVDPLVGSPTKPLESSLVYNYNFANLTLGGSATALIRSFEININNNLSRQQTDAFVGLDVYEGTREVTCSFDLIFDTLTEYNKFHYGGAAGTAVSGSIYTTSAVLDVAGSGVNNNMNFSLPNIAYTAFPVEPNPGGDAVISSVAATAQRVTGTPVITAVVKNQHIAWA